MEMCSSVRFLQIQSQLLMMFNLIKIVIAIKVSVDTTKASIDKK